MAGSQPTGSILSFDGKIPSLADANFNSAWNQAVLSSSDKFSAESPATYHPDASSDGGHEAYHYDVSSDGGYERGAKSSTTTITMDEPSGRAGKRSSDQGVSSYRRRETKADLSSPNVVRACTYPCTFVIYGCRSRFWNTNDWRRHIQAQHILLEHWHCQQCEDVKTVNDFSRRDQFIQHVVRMQPFALPRLVLPTTIKNAKKYAARGLSRSQVEQQYLDSQALHCHRQLRQPPETSKCVLCGQSFDGPGTWEHRLEHIGRHFEEADWKEARDPQNWHNDYDLEQ